MRDGRHGARALRSSPEGGADERSFEASRGSAESGPDQGTCGTFASRSQSGAKPGRARIRGDCDPLEGTGMISDPTLGQPSSELFRKHVYGCFFNDAHGLRSLEEIGVDNVTYESDYPHSDSTWPDTRALAEEHFEPGALPTEA